MNTAGVQYSQAMKFEFSQRGAYQNLSYRPIFRASAIFLAIVRPDFDTVITFMNYWREKNHISSVSALLTLRNAEGEKVLRQFFPIEDFVYEFSAAKLLGLSDFCGSIEVEFFSSEDLKYPFPAVDVYYVTPMGVSFVHSSQRIFNDIEDMDRGALHNPQQSCFDVLLNREYSAFITLLNGPRKVENASADLTLYNHAGEIKACDVPLGNLPAHGAKIIYFDQIPGIENFFGERPGFCKADFKTFGIFNRVVCGNTRRDRAFKTLTHSFYDCSPHADYFRKSETPPGQYHAFYSCTLVRDLETEIIFYPIYSKAKLLFSLSAFSPAGELIKRIENFASLDTAGRVMLRIPARKILREHGCDLDEGLLCLDLDVEGEEIPARLNFGLNYSKDKIGCNISTSVWMNKAFAMRKRSFTWGPIWLDGKGKNLLLISNLSHIKNQTATAQAEVKIFNSGKLLLTRKFMLNNAGSLNLVFEELLENLPDIDMKTPQVLWFSLESAAPSITCNQLYVSPSGYVGGDHSF